MPARTLEHPGIAADPHSSLFTLEPGADPARPIALIPAYKPEAALWPLVQELSASGALAAILIVDDGGGPRYRELFHSLAQLNGVTVLTHAVNLGKGAALKTGLNHAACCFPASVGVVTADADGQHSAADILKVAASLSTTPNQLLMGTRRFDSSVPFRSRFGNTLTRHIMRVVTGQTLADTQSGLRAIPLQFLPSLLKLRATGYDFELDMLIKCKDAGQQIREVSIATIYIENNRLHLSVLTEYLFVKFWMRICA